MRIIRSYKSALFLIGLVIGVFLLPATYPAAQTENRPWRIWRNKAECAGSRNGWLAAAQDYPGGQGWLPANGSRPQPTFAAAMAELDRLRLTDCFPDTAACTSFKNDCCLFNVWRNTANRSFSVVRAEDNPGPGFILEKSGMCCEDAAEFAGLELGCGDLRLSSSPAVIVRKTAGKFVSLGGPVTIPSNPPIVLAGLGQRDGRDGKIGGIGRLKNPIRGGGDTGGGNTGGGNTAASAIHYVIDKVTGTNYSGSPRDLAKESEGDLPPSGGTIPVSYNESWNTGHATMNGSINVSVANGRARIRANASWSSQGLGFGRPTGIVIGDKYDDKGSLANGSASASLDWEGPATSVTVEFRGKQNRIVRLTWAKN